MSVTERRSGLGLLRHRDFRHVWAANAINKVGTGSEIVMPETKRACEARKLGAVS